MDPAREASPALYVCFDPRWAEIPPLRVAGGLPRGRYDAMGDKGRLVISARWRIPFFGAARLLGGPGHSTFSTG